MSFPTCINFQANNTGGQGGVTILFIDIIYAVILILLSLFPEKFRDFYPIISGYRIFFLSLAILLSTLLLPSLKGKWAILLLTTLVSMFLGLSFLV